MRNNKLVIAASAVFLALCLPACKISKSSESDSVQNEFNDVVITELKDSASLDVLAEQVGYCFQYDLWFEADNFMFGDLAEMGSTETDFFRLGKKIYFLPKTSGNVEVSSGSGTVSFYHREGSAYFNLFRLGSFSEDSQYSHFEADQILPRQDEYDKYAGLVYLGSRTVNYAPVMPELEKIYPSEVTDALAELIEKGLRELEGPEAQAQVYIGRYESMNDTDIFISAAIISKNNKYWGGFTYCGGDEPYIYPSAGYGTKPQCFDSDENNCYTQRIERILETNRLMIELGGE